MRNTIKFLTAIFLLSSFSLIGQIETANKIYKKYGFKVSIPKYEKMEDLSVEELAKVANSYRLNHDTENAEIWYSEVVEKSNDPTHILHYAQALQSNNKLEEAKEYYLRYDEMVGEGADDRRGELLAQSIDRIRDFQVDGVEIKNEEILNTEKLDFSPSYCKDGIVFVTTRGVPEDAGRKDIWMDDNFTSLYCSTKNDDGSLSEPEQFSHALTSKFHDGPVSFSKNGKTLYFSSNHYDGKRRNTKKGVMKQQIYRSRKSGKNWSEPEEMNFNDQQHEEVHPSLSPDGRKLYFASDRPGGYGGMDLYVVNKRGNGWSQPMNLGEEINTKGNELFPFVHDDGTLYFASNGLEGVGGLDIYQTEMISDSMWLEPQNMGIPYNSPMDDFGFILDPTGTEGYLTSARDGGFGQDDIYSFRRGVINKKNTIPVQICTYEDGTDNRIAATEVIVREVTEEGEIVDIDEDFVMRLVETENKDEYILKLKKDLNDFEDSSVPTYTTDTDGIFLMDVKPGVTYHFEAKKNGYTVATAETTFERLSEEIQEFCIPLKGENCLTLVGNTINEKYKSKMIPGTKVTIVNLCTGEEQSVRSDQDGFYSFPCLECECDYVLKGEKTNFSPGTAQATTVGEDCTQAGTIVADIYLSPGDPNDIFFASNKIPGESNISPGYKFGDRLEVGQVIELKNIYYDFDQYYIREDAQDDLDKVVTLMKAYPTLIVELSSHTDARASYSYNETLSQNRAEAAVEYITKHGISPHRLKAKGYGENKLRNKCKNGSDCTEEEHQYNRRTEVKILEHHEKNFNIEYIDNDPETIDPADPNRKWGW